MNFALTLACTSQGISVVQSRGVSHNGGHPLFGDVSDATRATIARATTAQQTMALTLGSPEFQKR